MGQELVNFIITYATANPVAIYGWAFVASFLESLAFVGTIVPGTALVVASGFVAEQVPRLIFWPLLVGVVMVAAITANVLSYLVGRYYGFARLQQYVFFRSRQKLLQDTQTYFASRGAVGIISAHFLGPLRSVVSLVAGLAQMSWWRFLLFTSIGCLLWAFASVGVGYLAGASWEVVVVWGSRVVEFVLFLLALIAAWWWLGYEAARHEQTTRRYIFKIWTRVVSSVEQNKTLLLWLKKHPSVTAVVKKYWPWPHDYWLFFGLSVMVWFGGLLCILVFLQLLVTYSPLGVIDSMVGDAFSVVRTPELTTPLIFITNLAGTPVIFFVLALGFALWLDGERWRSGILLIGAMLSNILTGILKFIFARTRPDVMQALVSETQSSFPSGHAVAAVVVYGYIAALLVERVKLWPAKVAIVFGVVALIFAIGLSRVYLGVHWTSDVLAGYLLGGWCLGLMLIVRSLVSPSLTGGRARISINRQWWIILAILLVIAFYSAYSLSLSWAEKLLP